MIVLPLCIITHVDKCIWLYVYHIFICPSQFSGHFFNVAQVKSLISCTISCVGTDQMKYGFCSLIFTRVVFERVFSLWLNKEGRLKKNLEIVFQFAAFTSWNLKAQFNFSCCPLLAHLSFSDHLLSVHSSACPLFIVFSRTTGPISTQLCTKHPWGKAFKFAKMKAPSFFQGKSEIANILWWTLKIFSRTKQPILTKLRTKHHLVKGIQVCSNKKLPTFPSRDNKIGKIYSHN